MQAHEDVIVIVIHPFLIFTTSFSSRMNPPVSSYCLHSSWSFLPQPSYNCTTTYIKTANKLTWSHDQGVSYLFLITITTLPVSLTTQWDVIVSWYDTLPWDLGIVVHFIVNSKPVTENEKANIRDQPKKCQIVNFQGTCYLADLFRAESINGYRGVKRIL